MRLPDVYRVQPAHPQGQGAHEGVAGDHLRRLPPGTETCDVVVIVKSKIGPVLVFLAECRMSGMPYWMLDILPE